MKNRFLVYLVLAFLVLPSFSSAATIADLQAQLQVLMAQLTALQTQTTTPTAPPVGGATSASCPNLVRNLFRGLRGTDVAQFQQFLISQNLLASDSATGFFGALTEKAVQQWQAQHGIASNGSPATTGYGAVGPKTRAAIANKCGTTPPTIVTSAPTTAATPYVPPVTTTATPIIQTYSWQTGGWSACTNATQSRTVSCMSSNNITTSDASCSSVRPAASQSCTITTTPQNQSCTFNNQTVLHGASVSAYQASSVAYGQTCAQQTRTCSNGTLSGSYTYTSCTPASPTCTPLSAQTQTISCPTGQTGSITQTRTSSCATGATSPTWGAWQTTSDTCQAAYHTGGTITVGAPVIAIPHADIAKVASAYGEWIDAPLSTFKINNVQYWLKSDSFDMAKLSGPLDSPFSTTIWDAPTSEVFNVLPVLPVADGNRLGYWIVNTYQDTNGILAFVHTEYPKNPTPTTYDTGRSRIGLAWSSDGGDHFAYLGEILSPYTDPATSNIQGSPYIIKDGYFYTYFSDEGCGNWEGGTAVARALVSDVITAAKQGHVTPWNKYYNGGWQSAGIGGNCSYLGVPGITHTDAAFSTYTGKYYLITSRMNWGGEDTWIKLYESSDGINWTYKRAIVQESATAVQAGYQYASIVNSDGADNGVVGKTFYIYSEKDAGTNSAVVFRWLVDLDGSGDVIPTPPQKSAFSFVTDYAGTQGANQWSYLYRIGSSDSPMTWGSAPYDSAVYLWRGNETYLLLDKGWMHPGAAADAVLKWTAPRSGTVRITGTVFDGNGSCGNGVIASIRHNGTQLAQYTVANGDSSGRTHDVTEQVTNGNSIYFIVNSSGGDNACDTTNWSPTIEFL